jgi:peptidoglycan/LPS O-acetylase OafA/YrhL
VDYWSLFRLIAYTLLLGVVVNFFRNPGFSTVLSVVVASLLALWAELDKT